MAAYAAVVSLMNTVENIHNHPLYSFSLEKKQIQSLHKIIDFLLDFIESYNSQRGSKEKEVLESQIASTAHSAEDVLESHLVDRILAGSTADHGETSSSYLLDLEGVIKDMKSVKKQAMQFKETTKFKDRQPPSYSMAVAPSKPFSAAKNVMVGFDDELIQIMDRLTGHQPDLQIVPIVGMGGIGKTTLANNVYENLVIVEHFDVCAWATISQEYSVINILAEINKNLGNSGCEIDQETEEKLGVKLFQSLWGRRYLIVLDDVWSIEAWDRIRFFFPDNGCRSRVVITTRITNVATHLSSSSFEMNFLDKDKSWRLFCVKTFLEEGCPPELEKIGKKIVGDCKGLPLSISVIGGLLRNSTRTPECWEYFERDLNSILISGNDEHCLNLLSLSYTHLPAPLKPCFLYMGVFPENFRVYVTTLIQLFVSEGFLKPNKTQSLEEIADDYLNDLVDRNLILVESRRLKNKIKYLRMHDLVKEVCLRIAEKEKFFYKRTAIDNPLDISSEREKFFYKIKVIGNPLDISRERRIAFYNHIILENDWPQVFDDLPTASLVRTFISNRAPLPSKCRLLRVLSDVAFDSAEAILPLVNLRYLTCTRFPSWKHVVLPSKLPSSISVLWNLQTLILEGRVDAPVEIWRMRQLRHLQFNLLFLPDPPPSDDDILLPNLQTLSKVLNFSLTEEVCKRIQNITKLRIRYDDTNEEYRKKCYYRLDHLHKLQSLTFSFDQVPERGDLLQTLVFPSLLMKLSLKNSHLHWEDLNTFALSLPHLEVLKLCEGAVVGPEWECVKGAFPRLKFLRIWCEDLIYWSAENSECFPVLEKLYLGSMEKLEMIPSCMGELETLRHLSLNYCSESAAISAAEILEEQLSLGNEDFKVTVYFFKAEEQESFREKVEVDRFTAKNFEQSISRCIIS